MLVMVGGGCTRNFFRERADEDVEGLLNSRNNPRWPIENWHVYPDGRSRFVDTDNPDHPKKPPDDPGVAESSINPQPLRSRFCAGPDQEGLGYLEYLEMWDLINRANQQLNSPVPAPPSPGYVESGSQQSIDKVLLTKEQPYRINLEQACELSIFNSRDFQDRREDLYLTALPVTLQRFSFLAQFAATEQAIREWRATDVAGGRGDNWFLNSTGSVSQLVPTGATLVAQLANRLVIDLSTQRPTVGLSNLTLELTQPLLRGGGWAVTMEPLTQAQRNLVYGIRSYARFRKNYYVYIAGGADQFNAPYSYAGLNLRGVGPSLNAPSQGYLPTLLSAAQERNERENIRTLNKYLDLFREYQGKGDFSELQVGQVEQQLLRGQSNLLARRQDLQNGLDQFKLQLGVPTRLGLELDDEPLLPINRTLENFAKARDQLNSIREDADQYPLRVRQPLTLLMGGAIAPIPLELPLRERLEDLIVNSQLVSATKQFKANITPRWDRWKKMTTEDIKDLIKTLSDELRTLQVKQAQVEKNGERLEATDAARLVDLPKDIALGQLEAALRGYEASRKAKNATARDIAIRYEETVNYFVLVLSEARKERQAMIRAAWPALPGVVLEGVDLLRDDLDRAQTVASQLALGNRLELMNSRGAMVDSWRQIAVQANTLLGIVNVGYNMTTTSTPNANEPLELGGSRSRHQLILTGELPLVRRAERNNYRTALIAYQRARRNLQATEDFILNDVRTDLRNLRVLAENYRIQQRAVEVAYDQVENALDVLQAPPIPDNAGANQPGRAAAQNQQQAANAASLTQQLLNAQGSLLQAQNTLYTIWVNYLIARMTLYRDLELLPLDARGVWLDERSLPIAEPEVLPIPVPRVGGNSNPSRFADSR